MSLTTIFGWQYGADHLAWVEGEVPPDPPEGGGELSSQHGYKSSYQLLMYLPGYFREDPYIREAQNAIGLEIDLLRGTLDDILGAAFVDTASEWALRLWEADSDLPIAPDNVSQEKRRETVKANLGQGPRTKEDYESLVVDFFGPSTGYEITETFASYAVTFSIYASATDEEKEAFEAQVRRLVPAHLDLDFQYGTFIAGVSQAGDTL